MRALVFSLALVAARALAWESTCRSYADPSLEPEALLASQSQLCTPASGPSTARSRWVGANDEHRQLFELARRSAGLPDALSRTLHVDVFTNGSLAAVGQASVPTLMPTSFLSAASVQTRSFTLGELAQLPDFSYALWDWVTGNEQCPLPGASSSVDCHDFAAHMGPVNSNHFLPQAQVFYAAYHSLALGRAKACGTMKTQLGSQAARFATYLEACENEALALEAVGQHYLQDAWSMGHMWQRWGSSNLDDFPGASAEEKRDRAVLTALVSGFFHGARGVLQALPEWTTLDVNDAMCAPWPTVRFSIDGEISQGIGDDYLKQLPAVGEDSAFARQAKIFLDCATTGLLEVYLAAGENHGAATPVPGLVSKDVTGAACFGQRATNSALAQGAAIDLKVLGQQASIPIDARLASFLVPKVARAQGKVDVPPRLRDEFRFSLMRVVTLARVRAKEDPDGTDLAEGRWGELLSVKPNGAFMSQAPYLDPAMPWNSSLDEANASTPQAALTRFFHQAHAEAWCGTFDGRALWQLKSRATDQSLSPEAHLAAVGVCQAFARRHLRIGSSAAAYDHTQEPLCSYLVADAALVYQPATGTGATLDTLAEAWCSN
jgi:hypothetical protein